MRYLDLTLPTAAENLVLDEALLAIAETGGRPAETLRFWEAAATAVVVGRSSRLKDEVLLDACLLNRVPVLRRPSGGAAIVTGPGCLMYALVLSYEKRPELRPLQKLRITLCWGRSPPHSKRCNPAYIARARATWPSATSKSRAITRAAAGRIFCITARCSMNSRCFASTSSSNTRRGRRRTATGGIMPAS